MDVNAGSKTIGITLSTVNSIVGDTETSVSSTSDELVVEILDDIKTIGFETDTLTISTQGNFLESIVSDLALVTNVDVNLTLDLPAGINSNSGTTVTIGVGETSGNLSLSADPSSFSDTDDIGSVTISSVSANGDAEVQISTTNQVLVIRTEN